jgi:Dolichyl-phosphate-mannose-protein mannosyltransferase
MTTETVSRTSPKRVITALRSQRAASLTGPGLLLGTALVGVALIAASYANSARATDGKLYYHLYWAGVLVFLVPAVAMLVRSATRRNARIGLVIAIAVFSFVPKYLRTPTGPLYHDELGHWRQVEDMVVTGHLFQPNAVVPIIQDFPGLQSVTGTVRLLTGLPVWDCATLIVALVHVLTLLGVFLLVEELFDDRAGAVAALIYALNPNFVYFDTQYGYETLSIGLIVWALVCLSRMQRALTNGERWSWATLTVLFGASCVVTHHLSSIFLGLMFFLVTVVATLLSRRSPAVAVASWVVFGTYIVIDAVWLLIIAPQTRSYLSPYLSASVTQLLARLANHGDAAKGSRELFAKSPLPQYEHWAAFCEPVFLGLLALVGLWLLYRWREQRPVVLGLSVFGLLYFPSVLFTLVSDGAEGARRSWTFSFVGLAVLLAPGVTFLLERFRLSSGLPQRITVAVFAGSYAVVTMGSVAAGMSEEYRFPRPYQFGFDTRTITPEIRSLAGWLDTEYGPSKVITDRFTAQTLAAFAKTDSSTPYDGFPVWELFFHIGEPDASLLNALRSDHYELLIIDKRVSEGRAPGEPFFGAREPVQPDGKPFVISPAALSQYERYPWTIRVYESTHYAVYRFAFTPWDYNVQRNP